MRIALFGATEEIGRRVLDQALDDGHRVTALVGARRDLPVDANGGVRVFVGRTDREADVAEVIAGSHAVISVLGADRGREPSTVSGDGMRAIVTAMARNEVRRVLAVSAYGIGETYAESGHVRRLWRRAPERMLDLEAMEQRLRASDTDWTIVRPPSLTKGPRSGKYEVGDELRVGPLAKISRADVADFVLAATVDETYVRQAVQIASA